MQIKRNKSNRITQTITSDCHSLCIIPKSKSIWNGGTRTDYFCYSWRSPSSSGREHWPGGEVETRIKGSELIQSDNRQLTVFAPKRTPKRMGHLRVSCFIKGALLQPTELLSVHLVREVKYRFVEPLNKCMLCHSGLLLWSADFRINRHIYRGDYLGSTNLTSLWVIIGFFGLKIYLPEN